MNGINSVKNYKYSFLVKKNKKFKNLKKGEKKCAGTLIYAYYYVHDNTGAMIGGGGRYFLKIGKNCSNLRKKGPDCGHLWVKCLTWNGVLKSFHTKKTDIFSLGAFLSRVVGEWLSKCTSSKKTPLPWKIPGYAPDITIRHWVKSVQIRCFFWSECGKIRTRKNSIFGHFSRSENVKDMWSCYCLTILNHIQKLYKSKYVFWYLEKIQYYQVLTLFFPNLH